MEHNMIKEMLSDIAIENTDRNAPILFDKFQRKHDYLRISITESCNMNCFYCMPDDKKSLHVPSQWMTKEEILNIAKVFVDAGVRKIRVTGGEPLVRKEAAEIIKGLSNFPIELTLTTNGVRIDEFIDIFQDANIRSLKVSLDTLDEDKYFKITKSNSFQRVYNNILLLCDKGFKVKVNLVVIKGVNDDEILNFIEWTKDMPIHVRFI